MDPLKSEFFSHFPILQGIMVFYLVPICFLFEIVPRSSLMIVFIFVPKKLFLKYIFNIFLCPRSEQTHLLPREVTVCEADIGRRGERFPVLSSGYKSDQSANFIS